MKQEVIRVQSPESSRSGRGAFRSRSSLDSRLWTLATFLLLSACGFQPLHSKSYRESLAVDLSSVSVSASGAVVSSRGAAANPAVRRYSQLLIAEIKDLANPSGERAEKKYKLNITFSESQQGLFVNPDGTASRGDLVYDSNYTITRLSDNKTIANGSLRRVSTFNTSDTADYASYVSIDDARRNGIVELAQDYKMRLAALLPTLNNPDAEEVTPVEKTIPALPQIQRDRLNETQLPRY